MSATSMKEEIFYSNGVLDKGTEGAFIYKDDKPSILSFLCEEDAWINILNCLNIREIGDTRQVSKMWQEKGKERMMLYRIGMTKDGWSKWDCDKQETYGWGMKISVDSRGIVRGANKNNGDHTPTAREKVYTGTRVNGVFRVQVFFPTTEQENCYTGSIVIENGKPVFKGTFTLLRSTGHRPEGTGGIVWGLVQEA